MEENKNEKVVDIEEVKKEGWLKRKANSVKTFWNEKGKKTVINIGKGAVVVLTVVGGVIVGMMLIEHGKKTELLDDESDSSAEDPVSDIPFETDDSSNEE